MVIGNSLLRRLSAIQLFAPRRPPICAVQYHATVTDCPALVGNGEADRNQVSADRDFGGQPVLPLIIGEKDAAPRPHHDKTLSREGNAQQRATQVQIAVCCRRLKRTLECQCHRCSGTSHCTGSSKCRQTKEATTRAECAELRRVSIQDHRNYSRQSCAN
ncbi:hypothetical protein D3C73_1241890 [compost metagenome]